MNLEERKKTHWLKKKQIKNLTIWLKQSLLKIDKKLNQF